MSNHTTAPATSTLPTASQVIAAADTLHTTIHEHHLATGAPGAPRGMMLTAVVAAATAPGETEADRRARAAAHLASGWAAMHGIASADSAAALLASGTRGTTGRRAGMVDSMLESLTAVLRDAATEAEHTPALNALHAASEALRLPWQA